MRTTIRCVGADNPFPNPGTRRLLVASPPLAPAVEAAAKYAAARRAAEGQQPRSGRYSVAIPISVDAFVDGKPRHPGEGDPALLGKVVRSELASAPGVLTVTFDLGQETSGLPDRGRTYALSAAFPADASSPGGAASLSATIPVFTPAPWSPTFEHESTLQLTWERQAEGSHGVPMSEALNCFKLAR